MGWECGDYHGHHVAEGEDAPVDIKWTPQVWRGERVRVRDYTCECRSTVYELCKAGGITFIRRTRRMRGKVVIDEFTTRPDSRVGEIWHELLGKGASP
jgi:hypothetical protein